jgi:hypothetical protein
LFFVVFFFAALAVVASVAKRLQVVYIERCASFIDGCDVVHHTIAPGSVFDSTPYITDLAVWGCFDFNSP